MYHIGESEETQMMSESDHKTAELTEQYPRIAEVTDELAALMGDVDPGDSLTVEYVRDGADASESFTVERMMGIGESSPSVDVWSEGGAFLHVNLGTGDYYFQDGGREEPEDGREVASITLREGGESDE